MCCFPTTDEPLKLLDIYYQKCIVYNWNEITLELGYLNGVNDDAEELLVDCTLDYHVEHSSFMCRESTKQRRTGKRYDGMELIPQNQFDSSQHWIQFSNLRTYRHTVWKHTVLDLNGSYILENINDRSDDGEYKTVEYEFRHQVNRDLRCLFTFYESSVGDFYEMGQYK
eukprot:162357_1